MIGEISILCMLFGFCQSHEWKERPLDRKSGKAIGTVCRGCRHVQGFYSDGTNSGYFQDSKVRQDDAKNIKKYNKYKQRDKTIRDENIMKQAEKNVASSFTANKYNVFTHNCQSYKKAVNKEYDNIKNKNGKKNEL